MAIMDHDPAKVPCDDKYTAGEYSMCTSAGPGGNDTLTNNNEKGILEHQVFDAMANCKMSPLVSGNGAERQGIYRTNN